MMDDRKPYIYKTTDFGKTWKRISDGLPQDHPLAYTMSLAENPNRKGMLFAGTGNGMYYSSKTASTGRAQGGPARRAGDLDRDLQARSTTSSSRRTAAASTCCATSRCSSSRTAPWPTRPCAFYEPRIGYRRARSGSVDFTFALKAAPAPRDTLTLEMLDSAGAVVRTMRARARAGANRLTLGSALRRSQASRAAHDAAGQPEHLE